MADLYAKIRASITSRLEVARAATPGPWTTSGPDTVAEWTVYDSEWSVASATAYSHDEPMSNKPGARGPGYIDPDANAAHIAANDPKATIALCEALLRILDELPPQHWIIRELAIGEGIEVDG